VFGSGGLARGRRDSAQLGDDRVDERIFARIIRRSGRSLSPAAAAFARVLTRASRGALKSIRGR
jgi:hypothetical protein